MRAMNSTGRRWRGRATATRACAVVLIGAVLVASGTLSGTATAVPGVPTAPTAPTVPTVSAGADGRYATFARAGGSGAYTADVAIDATGFPRGSLTSDATSVQVPTGASSFLGAGTPFGAEFGSSQGRPYLTAGTAAGFAPSTTTITFAHPTPAVGWGFALGDVDADAVTISATDAAGAPLTGAGLAAALGWQAGFNYCATSPKPSTCTGPGPFTDVPTWNAATATLTGSGTDTSGASGWFRPTVALRSLVLRFTRQSGSPVYQLWIAGLAVPVRGTVDGVTGDVPGLAVDLLDPSGTPVTEPDGTPAGATVGADGSFAFPDVAEGSYTLVLRTPADVEAVGPTSVPITVDGPTVLPAGTFAVRAVAAPPTTTAGAPPSSSFVPESSSTTESASESAPASSGSSGAGAGLADTGRDSRALVLVALACLLAGAAALVAGRRRPVRRH